MPRMDTPDARGGCGHGHGNGRGSGKGRGRFGFGRGRGRCDAPRECTLDCLKAGESVEVSCIDDESARVHALRFGMGEGARVACVTRIPAGPVILMSGRQEIAVGHKLARRIHVLRDEATAEEIAS